MLLYRYLCSTLGPEVAASKTHSLVGLLDNLHRCGDIIINKRIKMVTQHMYFLSVGSCFVFKYKIRPNNGPLKTQVDLKFQTELRSLQKRLFFDRRPYGQKLNYLHLKIIFSSETNIQSDLKYHHLRHQIHENQNSLYKILIVKISHISDFCAFVFMCNQFWAIYVIHISIRSFNKLILSIKYFSL